MSPAKKTATKKATTRKTTTRRKRGPAEPRGPEARESALDRGDEHVVALTERVERAKGSVLAAYRAVPARMPNVEVHVFPGVDHGYMMPAAKAFHAPSRAFSMARALAILDRLRGDERQQKLAS